METEVLTVMKAGAVPESAVDASARRVLKLVFRAAETLKSPATYDYDAYHALAAKAAEQGAALLKNDGGGAGKIRRYADSVRRSARTV